VQDESSVRRRHSDGMISTDRANAGACVTPRVHQNLKIRVVGELLVQSAMVDGLILDTFGLSLLLKRPLAIHATTSTEDFLHFAYSSNQRSLTQIEHELEPSSLE
jgi:hypothetical protein